MWCFFVVIISGMATSLSDNFSLKNLNTNTYTNMSIKLLYVLLLFLFFY